MGNTGVKEIRGKSLNLQGLSVICCSQENQGLFSDRLFQYKCRKDRLAQRRREREMFNPDNNYEKFENKVWLSSPTMYPDSMRYVMEAYETNWIH